jgi:hypothetical protein
MIATGFFDDFLEKRFIVWSKNGRRILESYSQKRAEDQSSSLKRPEYQKKSDLLAEQYFQSPDLKQKESYQMPPELEANFWLGGPCLHTHH